MSEDLVQRLLRRAEIRRQISSRKSVQEGKPDRIADLLEEAAFALRKESMWEDISTAPKDGTPILVHEGDGFTPFIVYWTSDVYSEQGGKGGQAGWFSGEYSDRHGDYPILHHPKEWTHIPRPYGASTKSEE